MSHGLKIKFSLAICPKTDYDINNTNNTNADAFLKSI
jgi:hypothetical protein